MPRVYGIVLDEAARPICDAKITIESESIRGSRTLLASGNTRADGHYSIEYDSKCPVLRLRVGLTIRQPERVLHRVVDAPPDPLRVDFELGRVGRTSPPRYAVAHDELRRVLEASGEDLEGLDVHALTRAALAARVAPGYAAGLQRALASATKSGLPFETFLGLGEAGLGFGLTDAMRRPKAARRRALDSRIVERALTESQWQTAREALERLDELALEAALRPEKTVATPGLAFELAGVDAERRAILTRWKSHEGSTRDFWAALDLAEPVRDKLRFALQLAALTRQHAPLIRALFESHGSLADLATLNRAEWGALTERMGAPPTVRAESASAAYAESMFLAIENVLPTAMLAARALDFSGSGALGRFLRANESYDLRGRSFRAYLRAHPDALRSAGSPDEQDEVALELPILERLYRISPPGERLDTMRALRIAGFRSASQIQLLGRARFAERMRDALGEEGAARVYARAQSATAVAITLQMRHSPGAPSPAFAVLPPREVEEEHDAVEWASLFGGRTYCACDDCQSAFGPGAYLADLLIWLRGRGEHLDRIRARRPDIERLRLSCRNSHTVLPAIDLLLERLEAEVEPAGAPVLETSLDEAELAARPEHVHEPAYKRAAEPTAYPRELPYVVWLDQARTLLGALGVERGALMLTLSERNLVDALSQPEIAAEVLGVTRAAWTQLTGARAAATHERWGVAPGTTADLARVTTFLTRAGVLASGQPLPYETLEDLVRSRFVQRAGLLWIWFDNHVCDIEGARLVSADLDRHLDRLAALLHLSHLLGWSIADTDRALEVLGGVEAISEAVLVDLAQLRWLERGLRLSPDAVLDLFGPLDTRRWTAQITDGLPAGATAPGPDGNGRRPRLYASNADDGEMTVSPFQRRVGALDDARLFAVLDDGSELRATGASIATHLDAVASVVGLEPRWLTPLALRLGITTSSLANLSTLARHATLARALGIDPLRLVTWRARLGIDPFASPTAAVRLAVEVQRQASMNLREAALDTILGEPGARDLSQLSLPSVGEALLALSDEARSQTDPGGAARERAIVRRCAALLDVDPDLLLGLLEIEYDGAPARDALLSAVAAVDAARRSDPEGTSSTDAIAGFVDPRVFELIAVGAWLARAADLRVEDLGWWIRLDAATREHDLASLVLSPSLDVRYRHFAAFREAVRLPPVAEGARLFDLWAKLGDAGLSARALREELASRTGWPEEGLRAAIDDGFGGPLGGGAPRDWASPSRFGRLARWMQLSRALGVAAEPLGRWGRAKWEPSTLDDPLAAYRTDAAEIEQALRAVWGRERWLAEMPKVREGLRERARAALVAKLVGDASYPFSDADALGASLLMDVQLGACATTSRLKDATRSVQAFVQRVLLGEEPPLSLSDDEAREWSWRRRFRVWEANRKVFLYPENWIRPELLRDRTPLMSALSDELSQGNLSEAAVESAYRTYLRELASVSKLEVLAVLREILAPGQNEYHVFARSRTRPYRYWHRRWVGESRWTPWERIVDADGDNLIPIVYQRRVKLFWLDVSENTAPASQTSVPSVGEPIRPKPTLFRIHLCGSEWRDGGWAPASRSDAFIGVDSSGVRHPPTLQLRDIEADGLGFDGLETIVVDPRSTLFASASIAEHDLVVQVFKSSGRPPARWLPRFLVSGIDGRVTVEPPGTGLREHEGPTTYDSAPYRGEAQRWTGARTLMLPFPESTGAGSEWQKIVSAKPGRAAPITLTPIERARFSPTDPFVFDDDRGSYWVTFDRVRDLSYYDDPSLDLGAHRDDGLGFPPAAREGFEAQIEAARENLDAFRANEAGGASSLLPEGVVKSAVASGQKVKSVNGSPFLDDVPEHAIRMSMTVTSSDGAVLDTVESGSTGGDELVYSILLNMPAFVLRDPEEPGPVRLLDRIAQYQFHTFFHPHVGQMRETLNRLGLFGLLDPPTHEPLADQDPVPETTLRDRYDTPGVAAPYPADDLDFEIDGAFAQYNWELYFHVPFGNAARLHEAGAFDDARRWLHVIFDPTRPARAGAGASEAARSFWRFRPFREQFADGARAPQNIQQLLALLSADASDPAAVRQAERLLSQVAAWRKEPFDPHAIARARPQAYMAAVVMRYLDVILDQADARYRELTLEAVAEATELLLLAARLLGPRPEPVRIGERTPPTFAQLLADFDAGIGPIERAEEIVEAWEIADDGFGEEADALATLLYFCTPANPQLVARYWDRVADRLFKIRHCLDIEGRRHELALYEPPIDPELLVRAAAAGVDLTTLLANVSVAEVPHRRFSAMADLAVGLVSATQSLGQGLLSAIEKRDADQLASLRAQHERVLHDDTVAARASQIEEARQQLAALERTREATDVRRRFYEDKPRTNAREAAEQRSASTAKDAHIASTTAFALGSALALIPQFEAGGAGAGGSPVATVGFGGIQLAGLANGVGQLNANIAAFEDRQGRMALTEANYDRRKEGWDHQAELATKELESIDARIAASRIQLAMSEAALTTAETRKAQLDEIRTVLERRFGREELFQWLATQLSGLHYQSYELAYELAKRAERAFEYELGKTGAGFIRFGYWDGRQKGLLSAERLAHDLRRMQVAYLDEHRRRLEIEQTFSLREIDPIALVRLQQTGETSFQLSEPLFDLFYPGQLRRRIRAVRFTLPAVVAPHANVPALITLTGHRIRSAADLRDESLVEGGFGGPPISMTATSAAQRDGGVHELSFSAPRLLPFEGAGAISDWEVTLPQAIHPIDYAQIQDLLVHLAYDADYSDALRSELETDPAPVVRRLFDTTPPRRRVISLRREHAGTLRRLIDSPTGTPVRFEITHDVLPAYLRRVGVAFSNPALIVSGGDARELRVQLDERAVSGFAPRADLPLAGAALDGILGSLVGTHVIQVDAWGALEPSDPSLDLMIVVDLLRA
ncbi:MAG: neuraminidase-like domain-containing protein [Sandaracinaceae bacterium]